jgi:hypothetical protein
MNPLKSMASALAMLAMAGSGPAVAGAVPAFDTSRYRGHHAGGRVHEMFNLAEIMHARKNNQRGKNQKRMRGGK